MCQHQRYKTTQLLKKMNAWSVSDQGQSLLLAESLALEPYFNQCIGTYVAQIGGPEQFLFFKENSRLHVTRISSETTSTFKGPSVCADFEKWPFLPESIDLIFLPHMLELTPYMHLILSQSYDCLVPGGKLIITGFRPWNIWGALKYCLQSHTAPWHFYFRTLANATQCLQKENFQLVAVDTLCFNIAHKGPETIAKKALCKRIGGFLWENHWGIYIIVAVKEKIPLILDEATVQKAKMPDCPQTILRVQQTERMR